LFSNINFSLYKVDYTNEQANNRRVRLHNAGI